MIAKCKPLPCSISRIDWNIYILLFDKPFLFIYCIHPFSSGKTSIQFDPAPTVTFAHHLLSLSLSLPTKILSARPSSSLHSVMYNESNTAVTWSGNGPRPLTGTGYRISGGKVHFLDLIDKILLCCSPRTGLSWGKNLVSHLCDVQNASFLETPSSDVSTIQDEFSKVAADLRPCGWNTRIHSAVKWRLHWPGSFQSFRRMWLEMNWTHLTTTIWKE